MQKFKVFSVGWDPGFASCLLGPISSRTGIEFTHGVVGDSRRIPTIGKVYPESKWVTLSKSATELLRTPDYSFLASLESVGVPTMRSIIRGDRVLRNRCPTEALAYVTLLARRLNDAFDEAKPDVILGSFDSAHSALGLAIAKTRGIPWVAMAFPVMPDDLTGFCIGLTPNTLLPIARPIEEQLRGYAKTLVENIRSRNQKVVAYRAPVSITQWIRQYLLHFKNLVRRTQEAAGLGIDKFTYPTIGERLYDIARRSFNRLRLPTGNMLSSPPEECFIFYPFHMAPESMLDTWAPFYQNQLAFAAQLSLAIPADMVFVIKLHFSDPDNYSRQQLLELMKLPRLRIAHPGALGRDFIEKAALVVGIQGTACLEAALLGKPVLLFGDSPYEYFPRTERAKRPDELYQQIRRMLDAPPSSEEEIVEAFAAYMARYMPGRINDWGRPIEEDEFERLSDCFRALRSYVEASVNRFNWYSNQPFQPGNTEAT